MSSTVSADSEPAQPPVVARFTIRVEQVDGYQFTVHFDKDHYAALAVDEPLPLGKDRAPNAARLLAASIGSCLSASLAFCLGRAGVALEGLTSEVSVELVRNARKRLRIGHLDVTLRPRLEDGQAPLAACLETFEDFCVVTESVRQGVDVRVHVDAVAPSSSHVGGA